MASQNSITYTADKILRLTPERKRGLEKIKKKTKQDKLEYRKINNDDGFNSKLKQRYYLEGLRDKMRAKIARQERNTCIECKSYTTPNNPCPHQKQDMIEAGKPIPLKYV